MLINNLLRLITVISVRFVHNRALQPHSRSNENRWQSKSANHMNFNSFFFSHALIHRCLCRRHRRHRRQLHSFPNAQNIVDVNDFVHMHSCLIFFFRTTIYATAMCLHGVLLPRFTYKHVNLSTQQSFNVNAQPKTRIQKTSFKTQKFLLSVLLATLHCCKNMFVSLLKQPRHIIKCNSGHVFNHYAKYI